MKATWDLPKGVPSGQSYFLGKRCYRESKWILKYIKRRLFCFIAIEFLGFVREVQSIGSGDKNILWINWSAPSLGDSLMDLSARPMLTGRRVTLLTHPKNVELYLEDPYFDMVFSDPIILRSERLVFDLVICDSYSPRVLWRKLLVAPLTPFVGLYRYVNGFEVHRTRFAFERMEQLLGNSCTNYSQRPVLGFSVADLTRHPLIDVCIAVGGEWQFRTYKHWPEVVRQLVLRGCSVSLVGSKNGVEAAAEILAVEPAICSTVGQLSLREVMVEIYRAKVFIGADGGLWHIACAMSIPSVVLFADCQIFDEKGNRVTRETDDILCEVVYDRSSVSNLKPSNIISAFDSLLAKIGR